MNTASFFMLTWIAFEQGSEIKHRHFCRTAPEARKVVRWLKESTVQCCSPHIEEISFEDLKKYATVAQYENLFATSLKNPVMPVTNVPKHYMRGYYWQ